MKTFYLRNDCVEIDLDTWFWPVNFTFWPLRREGSAEIGLGSTLEISIQRYT